jgi:hypothetical protein
LTIGVRGTRFDFSVGRNGETSFALFEGGARLCDKRGRCVELSGRCAVVISAPGSGIRQLEAGPEREERLRAVFPYVSSQARLLPDFRVDTSSCKIQQAKLRDPLKRPLAKVTVAAVAPPSIDDPPDDDPPDDPPGRGNPGNGKNVGRAGENPGHGDFGGGSRGKGDGHGGGRRH